MSKKAKDWRASSQKSRTRKKVQVTLSDEAREKLERLAEVESKSEVVERLIIEAREPDD
jgi:hypothetical protein